MNSNKLRSYGKYALIAVLALIQYGQSTSFRYALDDSIFITKNSRVQEGLKNIPRLFENARTGKIENETGYRPFLLLTYATEVHLFGLDPSVSHRTNIVLYILLCCLILYLLGKLFPGSELMALLITVLFVVHPLHVEAVANIKGRGEILAMLFGVLYIITHLKFFETKKWYWLLLAPVVLLVASTGKENAITFAAVSVGVAFMVSKEQSKKVASLVGSVVSLASVLLMRLYVYSDQFFDNQSMDLIAKGVFHSDAFLGNPMVDITDKTIILANSLNVLAHSFKMFLVPSPLVHDYSYNYFPVVDWSSSMVYVGIAIVILTMILVGLRLKKNPYIAFGLLWFISTASIYISLVRPATDIFAERFMFTPSLGLCMALVGVLGLFKLDWKKKGAVVSFIAVVFLFMSYSRVPAWKDTHTLLETDIETLDKCVRANYNYALYAHQQYDNYPASRRPGDQAKILKHYNRALNESDRLANLYTALGNAYMRFELPEKAYPIFKEASEKYPDLSKPLMQIGHIHSADNQYDSAAFYFVQALEIGKTNPQNYLNLSLSLYHQNLLDSAVRVMTVGEEFAVNHQVYYQKFVSICIKADSLRLAEEVTIRGLEKNPRDQKLAGYKNQFDARKRSLMTRLRRSPK
ncbi:tetratricopeptide repeat protein [Flavobacteriales bacterium]|nr:tetratricopeptide repeat protein [Flavobacteriales bacterium]